jgi:hypothetical protein
MARAVGTVGTRSPAGSLRRRLTAQETYAGRQCRPRRKGDPSRSRLARRVSNSVRWAVAGTGRRWSRRSRSRPAARRRPRQSGPRQRAPWRCRARRGARAGAGRFRWRGRSRCSGGGSRESLTGCSGRARGLPTQVATRLASRAQVVESREVGVVHAARHLGLRVGRLAVKVLAWVVAVFITVSLGLDSLLSSKAGQGRSFSPAPVSM